MHEKPQSIPSGGLKWLVGVLFLVFLLCDPAGAAEAARGAMRTWAESVAPALFPFMAVLPVLTGVEARQLYMRALTRPMRALFALPGQSAAAVSVALLSGSPAGAIACAHVADSMSPREFRRMALTCCGMSPVYLISGIGVSLLHGQKAGFLLAGSQLAAQIISGIALRFLPDARKNGDPGTRAGRSPESSRSGGIAAAHGGATSRNSRIAVSCHNRTVAARGGGTAAAKPAVSGAFSAENAQINRPHRLQRVENPLRAAAINLMQVAGYMALFAVIARFAGNLLGEKAGKFALMALDLPGGAVIAAALPISFPAKMALLGGMSGFGGVCLAAQNMAVLGPMGVRWAEYLSVKCAHAAVCAALCFLGAVHLPALQPAAPAFAPHALPALEISSLSMLALLVPVLWALVPVRRRGIR